MKIHAKARLLVLFSLLLGAGHAPAATLYWDGTDSTANADGGAGTWNTALTNWDDAATGGANTAWVNASNNTAVFGGTAGTVSLGTGITVGGLQFDTSGYLIQTNTLTFGLAGDIVANADATISSVLAGSVAVNKTGSGMLTLTANNTYTGALTLTSGTLRANGNANALGTGAATLTLAGGILDFNHSAALSFNRNTTVTGNTEIISQKNVAGAGVTYTLGTLSIGSQTLTVSGGNVTSGTAGLIFGATTLTGTSIFNVSNPSGGGVTLLTLGATGDGGNGFGITKTGDGGLNLSAANTYTGTTTINGGYIRLSNATSLSGGIGATGGTSALTMNGGYLELANGNFSRALGSGADQFQITGGISGFSASGGARILNIGGAGASVTWGSSTFNPTTLVLNGTTANNSLDFQNALNLGGSSRGVFVGANTAIMSGIISNGGLTKSGSGTLILTNTSNSFANGVTISGGVLVATADSVLGDSAGSITLNGGRLRAATITLGGANLVTARDVTVNSGGGEIHVAKNNNFTTTGKLSGTGTLTLIDNGGSGTPSTYNFNSTSNDFTGGIIANNAILGIARLDDSVNNIVFNSTLSTTVVNNNVGLKYASTATSALSLSNRAIEFNSGVTSNVLIQNNNTTYAITIAKDLVATGAGAKTLYLDAATGPTNIFSGKITDGTGGGTISINKSGAGRWDLTGNNTFSGDVTVGGGGDLYLTGTNTFSGKLTVNGNSTVYFANGSLGSDSGASHVFGSSTGPGGNGNLTYIGIGDYTIGRSFQLGNTLSSSLVLRNNGSGALIFSNTSFNTPLIAGSQSSRVLTLGGSNSTDTNHIQGAIQDNNDGVSPVVVGLTKNADASIWKFSGNSSYTGATIVNGGTVIAGTNSLVSTDGAFGNASSEISLGVAGGNVDASLLIGGAFNVGRNIRLLTNNTSDSGTRVLTIGGNSAHNSEFSGNIFLGTNSQAGRGLTLTAASGGQVTFSGVIQNPTSMDTTNYTVTKSGAGRVVLNNTNTYTGATLISQGTLAINGTGSINNSAVTINGGDFRYNSSINYTGGLTFTSGTLSGTNWEGSLNGLTIGTNQTLSPGNSPGTATTTNQTWAAGGTYVWEVNNVSGTAGAASGWDLINGSGTLNITAAAGIGNTFTIDITSLTLGNIAGEAVGFDQLLNYAWLIADFGSISGFDVSDFSVDASGFTNAYSGVFAVAQGGTGSFGGDSSQIWVTYTAVPEPRTMILGALGILLILRRRR